MYRSKGKHALFKLQCYHNKIINIEWKVLKTFVKGSVTLKTIYLYILNGYYINKRFDTKSLNAI